MDAILAMVLASAAALTTMAPSARCAVGGLMCLLVGSSAALLYLGAPAVALAEVVVGVGVAGRSFWRSERAVRPVTSTGSRESSGLLIRLVAAILCASVAVTIAWAMQIPVTTQPLMVGIVAAIAFGTYGAIVTPNALRRVAALRTILCGALLILALVGSADNGAVGQPVQAIAISAIVLSAAGVTLANRMLRQLAETDGSISLDEWPTGHGGDRDADAQATECAA